MKNLLKKIINGILCALLYVFLRLRWIYFHINFVRYRKFYFSKTESHFLDMYTNEILSDIVFVNSDELNYKLDKDE